MRFSRRNKGPLAWARRSKSRAQDQDAEKEFGPVASEERSALLSPGTSSEEGPVEVPDDGFEHEESTQRILSALGRFHRQVTKAKVGAAQELWTDECMNELVAAAEVAVQEGWRDTVAVLTETGRILQTYEDAGRATECVQFLSEAYDVLSLMVGDLIVGEVRPGVMQKWRECHGKALSNLEASGLTLIEIENDEEEEEAEYQEASQPAEVLNTVPFELPPLDDYDEDVEEQAAGDAPTLDNLPSMGEDDAARKEPIDEALLAAEQEREQSAIAAPREIDPVEVAVAAITGGEDSDVQEEEAVASEIETLATGGSPDGVEESAEQEESAPAVADAAESSEKTEEPEVVATLDSFCEGLAKIEQGEDRDLTTVYVAMLDELAFLDKWAVDNEYTQAQRLTRAMALLCQQVTEGNAAPSDKFIELSYGFCEAYVEARSSEPTPLIETWLDECSALYRQWTAEPDSDEVPEPELAEATPRESAGADAEAADAPAAEDEITEPVALAVEDDGSPESLLRIAQEAVASGRGTEAKVYAMRAAAAFAQREAQQAQQRLSDIERRINEGGAHIEAARGELRGAEESVIEAEKKTRENEEALSSCGERTREGLEHLESIDTEIAELDERIRELQAQREAAAQRRAEADEELNRKRADESDAEATLDSQRAEEDNARNRLEEARQKVKNLERKRVELELEMERARDILSRQQSSLEDIEQTIAQLKNPEMGGAGESDELLF